jgi:hypothetical protein
VATIAPGKHRRPGPKMETPAGMPFSLSEYLQAPVDVSDPAIDDSGTWARYLDGPAAREPHVSAPLVPGAGAAEEAAHLRAVILSLSERLSEMSAYVAQNLGSPGSPTATRPAVIAPAQTPAIAPRTPKTGPGAPAAGKPQKQPRQYQAMRIATYASAALLVFALVSGATEIGMRGFKFFVFRPGGTGETAGTETDQQFLARQADAALHVEAPKGRHVIKQHEVRKR